MTLPTIAILLLIAVPLVVLVVDVIRMATGRVDRADPPAPGEAPPASRRPPAVSRTPRPAPPRPGEGPSSSETPSTAIRPGEGMVYRGPKIGSER